MYPMLWIFSDHFYVGSYSQFRMTFFFCNEILIPFFAMEHTVHYRSSIKSWSTWKQTEHQVLRGMRLYHYVIISSILKITLEKNSFSKKKSRQHFELEHVQKIGLRQSIKNHGKRSWHNKAYGMRWKMYKKARKVSRMDQASFLSKSVEKELKIHTYLWCLNTSTKWSKIPLSTVLTILYYLFNFFIKFWFIEYF